VTGNDHWLAQEFESYRPHLRAVSYRMLGSQSEADDAVQEAWLRLSRTDADGIENLGGWLTTVVARVCLNMLQSRKARREDPLDQVAVEPLRGRGGDPAAGTDPEQEAVQADAVGVALLVVLETLTPAERLAYVLHDLFALPFDEIAGIVDRSPAAARQLASRARRRVQGAGPGSTVDRTRQYQVVKAFLAASRGGDFDALLALLDPDVVVRADPAAVRAGAVAEVRGPAAVAQTFSGRAKAARLAVIDGVAGAVWSSGGRVRMAFEFTFANGTIAAIDLLADPDRLAQLELRPG
jgi:RNA polymerase sigma factor (sigma-70 family)